MLNTQPLSVFWAGLCPSTNKSGFHVFSQEQLDHLLHLICDYEGYALPLLVRLTHTNKGPTSLSLVLERLDKKIHLLYTLDVDHEHVYAEAIVDDNTIAKGPLWEVVDSIEDWHSKELDKIILVTSVESKEDEPNVSSLLYK